jgi:plasmid maintenance system antidote protein VapI
MIANNIEPYYPTHPGEILKAALDLPAEPLLKMQARYNMLITKRNHQFIEKLNKVRKITAVL